jgi:transcriptional regulator with XRE-family HTH domain
MTMRINIKIRRKSMITIDKIKELMNERGWSQIDLAEICNVSQPTVSRWLKGATPDPVQQERLSSLIREGDDRMFLVKPDQSLFRPDKGDLKIYDSQERRAGEMFIDMQKPRFAPAPWFIGDSENCFAVMVSGETMAPAYRPGEYAISNAKLPQIRNRDHIFIRQDADGETRAVIRLLVAWDDETWTVETYNPPKNGPKTTVLQRDEWGQAHRIVGKYEAA